MAAGRRCGGGVWCRGHAAVGYHSGMIDIPSSASPSPVASLTCTECGDPFTRTSDETHYYHQRAATPPTTCPDCRQRFRSARNAEMRAAHASGVLDPAQAPVAPTRSPAPFRRGAGSRDHSAGPGGAPRLFRAVCADCGRDTEVPFQPRSGRPVFCRDCFNTRRGR